MSIDLLKIGRILKEEREKHGYTIQDVSNALCVRKSLIQALEEGDWHSLPHEFYVKSYAKNYANFLSEYDKVSELLSPSLIDQSPETKEGTEKPLIVPQTQNLQEMKAPAKDHSHTKEPRQKRFSKTTAVYMIILAVVAAIFVYEALDRGGDQVSEQKSNVSRAKADTRPINTNTEVSNVPALAEGKKLMISCQERTWISVVIDGKEKKEFMLSPQEIIMLNAEEDFDLLIGNAGGVKLMLNGKDTEFTGKSGEVKRVKIS
jgi:cytoskeletal protein RodZ